MAATLRSLGATYRKNVRALPGSPDFANQKKKWAVFVHGCFWHHHTGCGRATVPKANSEFWSEKFARNRSRDAEATIRLRQNGFAVVIVWECELGIAAARLSKVLEPSRIDMGKPIDH